jgi:hypothetical protein
MYLCLKKIHLKFYGIVMKKIIFTLISFVCLANVSAQLKVNSSGEITLSQTGKQAQIVISNTAGNIVRQIPPPSGTDSVTIEGGTLPTGVYYSPYVGNSLADTKKMILTK